MVPLNASASDASDLVIPPPGGPAGYNCSLFAYGQTGSGKSYSMVGYGKERGIIPIACEKIFERVAENTDPDLTMKVTCSML